MLSAALLLLSGSLFFSLHLAENPHSFPKPLSAKEEETYKAEESPAEDWWRTSSLSIAPPNAEQLLSGSLRVDSYNRHLDIAYQTYLLLA